MAIAFMEFRLDTCARSKELKDPLGRFGRLLAFFDFHIIACHIEHHPNFVLDQTVSLPGYYGLSVGDSGLQDLYVCQYLILKLC